MPGSRSTAVVTASCLVLAATTASAGPSVMVWPGGPRAPVVDAEERLRAEGVELVPRAATHEAVAHHRHEQVAREGARREAVEAALGAAQDHYLALDLHAMLEALREAEGDALASARPGRCEGLWGLEFRWGLALATRAAEGDAAASRDRYALAVALDPPRRPLHELYGPDVTASFLGAVDEVSRRVVRPVPLRIEPADATVEIDCRAVTDEQASLRPGLHAVRVSAPGHRPWSAVVDSRGVEALEVALVPLPEEAEPTRRLAQSTEADPVDDGSVSAHAAVLDVAHEAGASAVLVVSATDEGWRVRPWGRDGIGAAVERRDLGEALAAALALLDDGGRLRTPAPAVIGPTSPGDDGPTSARRPVTRTWWLWTIIGTVAATGVAVGLGVGLSRREGPPGRLVIVAR